jgi:hypothetical protein
MPGLGHDGAFLDASGNGRCRKACAQTVAGESLGVEISRSCRSPDDSGDVAV